MAIGFFASVRYLRLKFLVSLLRLAIRLLVRTPKPKFDSIVWIPSRDKHRTIKAHDYLPDVKDDTGRGPRPVLVNFYGSGFALRLHGQDGDFCRYIATTTKYIVLDVEYRVGPEHPFPAAIHDAEDALQYVLSRPDEYAASHLSVSGFSSGGTLALVAPTLLPRGTLESVTAFYPATDLSRDPRLRLPPVPSAKPRGTFWTYIFREGYIGKMDSRDPRISPAFADTSNYPGNMLVVTGELDSSALEAEELAEKAKADSNRNVMIRRMQGCGHGFDKRTKNPDMVKAKDETYKLVADMLNRISSESG